jgi:hypothetical protein
MQQVCVYSNDSQHDGLHWSDPCTACSHTALYLLVCYSYHATYPDCVFACLPAAAAAYSPKVQPAKPNTAWLAQNLQLAWHQKQGSYSVVGNNITGCRPTFLVIFLTGCAVSWCGGLVPVHPADPLGSSHPPPVSAPTGQGSHGAGGGSGLPNHAGDTALLVQAQHTAAMIHRPSPGPWSTAAGLHTTSLTASASKPCFRCRSCFCPPVHDMFLA